MNTAFPALILSGQLKSASISQNSVSNSIASFSFFLVSSVCLTWDRISNLPLLPLYRDVKTYSCMFEISRLSAARQLGQPMHSQSANFGKFQLNYRNLTGNYFTRLCMPARTPLAHPLNAIISLPLLRYQSTVVMKVRDCFPSISPATPCCKCFTIAYSVFFPRPI